MDDDWEDEPETSTPQEIEFCTLGMFIIGKATIYTSASRPSSQISRRHAIGVVALTTD